MPRTGTASKDLFESYLQEWLWRQHYGDDPFAKTVSGISPTYMLKYRSSIVPLYSLFEVIATSWMKEIKYTASA